MRVRFGKSIYLCTKVTHSEGSKLLLITNSNGVYTIDMLTSEKAEEAFNSLLIDGYYDVSDYDYSNDRE